MQLPPVFLLDFTDQGYAVARHLSRYGVKIVAFLPNMKCIEAYSRIPYKKYQLPNLNEELLKALISAAAEFPDKKPVLFINKELYYPFLYEFYPQLVNIFSFEMPPLKYLKPLLEKDIFSDFCREHNVKTPLSIDINRENHFGLKELSSLQYPLVIKPKVRDEAWDTTYRQQKVFLSQTPEEAVSTCENLLKTTDRLILQEWIPGTDANVLFCLTYITKEGKVLASSCGQKVHTYPLLFGNVSLAIPVNNQYIINETHRILSEAGIYGFCSVEFKQHAHTGEYFVIEPTVGRMDRQEYFATLGPEDVVMLAYCHLADIEPFAQKTHSDNFIYLEESLEVKSCLDHQHYKIMNWRKYFKWLFSKKVKSMYLDPKDPIVGFLVILSVFKHLINYCIKGRTKDFEPNNGVDKLIKINKDL